MPKVTYLLKDGVRRELEVTEGTSLMEAACSNGIEGIVGECGGSAVCGTCHVYVDESFFQKLPAPNLHEQEMLQFVSAEVKPVSRLSCQIKMSAALDGIIVEVPENQ